MISLPYFEISVTLFSALRLNASKSKLINHLTAVRLTMGHWRQDTYRIAKRVGAKPGRAYQWDSNLEPEDYEFKHYPPVPLTPRENVRKFIGRNIIREDVLVGLDHKAYLSKHIKLKFILYNIHNKNFKIRRKRHLR